MRHLLLISLLLLMAACPGPDTAMTPLVFRADEHGGVTTILHEQPHKLTEIPVTVTFDSPPEWVTTTTMVARVDMPGMPMNVAPVALIPVEEGVYKAVLVFTMSGPWYVEIAATGPETWSVRYDVDVP